MMQHLPPPDVVPESHREKCLYWARIFELPVLGLPPGAPNLLAAAALRAYAGEDAFEVVPVAQWRIVVDEPALIYVVHPNAALESNAERRKSEWECWCVGRWIDHNAGGWTWHGMSGVVTHVARLPVSPIVGG